MDKETVSKLEAHLHGLKVKQSDYFKQKKDQRSEETINEVREVMNRLKGIMTDTTRGREVSEEDQSWAKGLVG